VLHLFRFSVLRHNNVELSTNLVITKTVIRFNIFHFSARPAGLLHHLDFLIRIDEDLEGHCEISQPKLCCYRMGSRMINDSFVPAACPLCVTNFPKALCCSKKVSHEGSVRLRVCLVLISSFHKHMSVQNQQKSKSLLPYVKPSCLHVPWCHP
jgi:hypothetical protein